MLTCDAACTTPARARGQMMQMISNATRTLGSLDLQSGAVIGRWVQAAMAIDKG